MAKYRVLIIDKTTGAILSGDGYINKATEEILQGKAQVSMQEPREIQVTEFRTALHGLGKTRKGRRLMITIPVVLKDKNLKPTYARKNDAGADLRSPFNRVLPAGKRIFITHRSSYPVAL